MQRLTKPETHCIILAAGAPHKGTTPTLLESINDTVVLDWVAEALAVARSNIQLILGYESDSLTASVHSFKVRYNANWKHTGSAWSLLQADLSGLDEVIVSYGDILFRRDLVDQLAANDSTVVFAWDSHWKKRYFDRDNSDLLSSEKVVVHEAGVKRLGQDILSEWATGEFIGLVRLTRPALDILRRLQKNPPEFFKSLHLSGLLEWLRNQGIAVSGVDVAGDWAEVNHIKDIAHFILGTKAETLFRLRQVVKSAFIQDQISCTHRDWLGDSSLILEKIREKFCNTKLVVRSSARSEDAFTHSNAGAYTSLLNVDMDESLYKSIDEVFASYHGLQPDDQVLVQPMVQDVVMSGVAFTRTLEHAAPWCVINYEESGGTDGITAGSSDDHKTLFVRRDASLDQVADQRLVPLVQAIAEIERLLAYDALDIEFALDAMGKVHILQVRPIAVAHAADVNHQESILNTLHQAECYFEDLQSPLPHIVGSRAVFGVMPDWNPAEIIGTNPSRLAESLYRYLILNETWATQRAEYGYRDVRPHPLLVSFAGKPFIDVRASFNSFVPANLPDSLAHKLVDFYLNWLEVHPHLHDKVEFDVVPTCLGLNFDRWRIRLEEHAGCTVDEINALKQGLREITVHAIVRTSSDLSGLSKLESRFKQLEKKALSLASPHSLLSTVRALLEECRLYGTLPFSHLARSGFVAVTLLKEAVATGVLSDSARAEFMSTVRTVSHELSEDAEKTLQGGLDWSCFVNKYGHLRPGTYDVTSPAYREDPEKYLRPLLVKHDVSEPTQESEEPRWQQQKLGFFDAVRAQGLDFSDKDIEQFLRDAIEGREKSKFLFSKNLSLALDLLVKFGASIGLEREVLAHLSIEQLLALLNSTAPFLDQKNYLVDVAERAVALKKMSLMCELPALICKRDDFYSFMQLRGQPNFIGQHSVIADCVNLNSASDKGTQSVEGCVVMIPQADPGYDWLFGQKIAGLVTMYGGANSHMAIRSAEFGLPAAIGIGEQLYRELSVARVLELDPPNARLKAVH